MKVNQSQNKPIKPKEEEKIVPLHKRDSQGSQTGHNRVEGRRENIVRMYQLLK